MKSLKDIQQKLGIERLPAGEQIPLLESVGKLVHKQFLADIKASLATEQFETLAASLDLGTTYFDTTLKHLAPHYETTFSESQEKVFRSLGVNA